MREYNKIEPRVSNVVERKEETKEQEQKVVKRITTAEPVKKNLFSRLGNAVFGENGIKAIGRYVGSEIVVPAIKGIIVDGFITGVTKAVYGDTSGPVRPKSYGTQPTGGYTNYNRYSSAQPAPVKPGNGYAQNVRASNRVGEYVIPDRADALETLQVLTDIAVKYGSVSVADYYDMIGVSTEYTDNSYGWIEEDLIHTTILSAGRGWIINLPRARALV